MGIGPKIEKEYIQFEKRGLEAAVNRRNTEPTIGIVRTTDDAPFDLITPPGYTKYSMLYNEPQIVVP